MVRAPPPQSVGGVTLSPSTHRYEPPAMNRTRPTAQGDKDCVYCLERSSSDDVMMDVA